MRATLARLASTRWVADAATLGGWTVAAQLLVVAVTPAVTRLYAPAELGSFGLFVSFLSFAGVAAALRYDMAIIAAADDAEAGALLRIAVASSLVVSLLGGAAVAVLIRFDLLSYGALPAWTVPGAVAAIAATGVFTSARCWHVRRAGFGAIGRALVGQAAGRAAVPVALGLARAGWAGLMLGEIAGRALGVARLLRAAWPAAAAAVRSRPGAYREALRRNAKYPGVALPSSLVDALATALPVPIVSALFGSAAAGGFFLVTQLAGWPANLAGAAAGDVFHERVSAAARSERARVPAVLWGAARHLAGVGLLVYVPAALLSPVAFAPVFGAAWRQAGILVAVLAPYLFALLVVAPLSRLLLVTGRQEWKLAADVVRLAVPVAAFVGGHRAGLGFLRCAALYSGLNVAAFAAYLAVIGLAARAGASGRGEPAGAGAA